MKLQPDKMDGMMYTAFFYYAGTQTENFYLAEIDKLRKRLRGVNIGLSSCTHEKIQNFPPKLIVVADEIFNMPDNELMKLSRSVVPNFYRNPIGNNDIRNNRQGKTQPAFSSGYSIHANPRELAYTDHVV